MEAARIADRNESVRSEVQLQVEAGCREAEWLLSRNAHPDVLYAHVVGNHPHEGCGWDLNREEAILAGRRRRLG